ncbi:MAG: PQQ-binding-like beta-propeller repeat protein [Zavarzinella sp.]
MNKLSLTVLLCGFSASLVCGQTTTTDWLQFRGPGRLNISPDKGLLKAWPEDGPKLVWKATGVGEGFSSVAMKGDTVVTMGDADGSCQLFAVKRSDGSSLWSTKVGRAGGGGGYPGPRCTPSIDGDYVYGIGQYGDLVCVQLADGKEVWRKSFTNDFGGRHGAWQFAESPLVDGNLVLCTPGGPEATMVALDKKSGEVKWKGVAPSDDAAGYSSIVPCTLGGVKQYMTLTSKGVVSFHATSGKLLWNYGARGDRFADNTANIPTPIPMKEQVFAVAGYDRGGALLTIRNNRGMMNATEVYWSNKLKNKHGGVILVGNFIYGDSDDSGRIWCADVKTGTIRWTRKDDIRASGSASMTYADGLLFVRWQNGYVGLVSANPAKYQLISSFKLPNGDGNCWAHPVVIGGKMYLREKDTIWCYQVSAKK